MTSSLTPSLRKAAVLIRSLDAESAAVLLAQLSTEEARAVREAMKNLGELDPLEQLELRDELRGPAIAADHQDDGGVELDFSNSILEQEEFVAPVAAAAVPPQLAAASPVPATVAPAEINRPFAWLEGGDLPSLAAILEREHLSTVAVVLSHLSPELASQVLDALPPSRRAAALERLADLGESDRDCLEVIERQLADWIAVQKAERQRRADRLRSIQAILSHSPGSTCDSVLAEIARHDRSLADEIGPVHSVNRAKQAMKLVERSLGEQAALLRQPSSPPAAVVAQRIERRPVESQAAAKPSVVAVRPAPAPQPAPQPKINYPFERIIELSQQQLAELFSHCDSETVVLALAGASQPVTQHIEKLLPKSVVKELHRRMHNLASVRLSELGEAQSRMAETAAQLFVDRKKSSAA